MMLVSMVHSNREKQQETLWTLVKVLLRGRLITENQRCPSLKSLAAFMKNRLLTGERPRLPNLWNCSVMEIVGCVGVGVGRRVGVRGRGGGGWELYYTDQQRCIYVSLECNETPFISPLQQKEQFR